MLVNVPKLVTALFRNARSFRPSQRVAFGTSGHRGSSSTGHSTNDISWPSARPFALSQGAANQGPLVSRHGHARAFRSGPDQRAGSLAANGVDVKLAEADEYTPTPVISTRFSPTIARASQTWPMVLSSPLRTIASRWWLQIQPANRRPAEAGVTAGSRPRQISFLSQTLRRQAHPVRESPRAATTHRMIISPPT